MTTFDPTILSSAITTANGEPEVAAPWVREHLGAFRFIDVREPHELEGPLGHVDGVENVPLLEVLAGCESCDRDVPVVLICRSGRRSALAARELMRAGVKHVASVEGGMIAWNLHVDGKATIVQDEKTANANNLADAVFNINGIPEVGAAWVRANFGRFKLIDVRNPDELRMVGHIPQAENIPLPEFMHAASSWERDQPLVIMCASGGRSSRAVGALLASGFTNVASLEGGMFGWRGAGLPHA